MKKYAGLLLAATAALWAQNLSPKYHISDVDMGLKYGLTSIDNDGGWDFSKHTLQASFLLHMPAIMIDPRVDMSYVNLTDGDGGGSLWQLALNAQYTFAPTYYELTPYLYAGLGYEYVHNNSSDIQSDPFLQAGGGVKYPIFSDTDLIGEFRALHILELSGSGQGDEFSLFVGLNVPLQEQSVLPAQESASVPTPPSSGAQVQMGISDKDGDGVPDHLDICPATPPHAQVDAHGCVPKAIRAKVYAAHKKGIGTPIVVAPADTPAASAPVTSAPLAPKAAKSVTHHTFHPAYTPGSVAMDSASRTKLVQLARSLKRMQFKKIRIEGYTDNSGDFDANFSLSLKRAQAVKRIFVQEGIPSDRIEVVGKGELSPIANNDTPEGRAQNRRIEITVLF